MEHEAFLDRHPVFTGEDLDRYLAARSRRGPRTKERLLAQWRDEGRLIRIRRGLYAVVPEWADPATFPPDNYLLAGKLTSDAVVSHHSALEFHGCAYSVWHLIVYSATRPALPMEFRTERYRGTTFPRALRRSGNEHFGVAEVAYRGSAVRITSIERTLVDVLASPHLGGGWEEIWRSMEMADSLNWVQVVDYALLFGNATTTAKVGFFLDQHRDHWTITDSELEPLRQLIPRQPHYLERNRRRGGRLLKEWNLIVPEEVLERSWEELLWI